MNNVHDRADRRPYWDAYPSPTHDSSVVLCMDTNVFVRHGFSIEQLESVEQLASLFSHYRVIVPEVVMQECERLHAEHATKLKGLRPRELRDRLSKLDDELTRLFDDHLRDWQERLEQIASIVPTSNELLRSAYCRLMAKRPPCHERDETRDAIIWEAVLAAPSYGKTTKIFVSDNKKDFPFDSHVGLQEEAKSAGILWFASFADLQQWVDRLRPTPWLSGADFLTWFKEQNFSWQTAGRLQDELPDYLLKTFDFFDWDVEISDLDRTEETVLSEPAAGVPGQAVVAEKWVFEVSYAVCADIRIGGSDGIETTVSDWRRASGTVSLKRALRLDANGSLLANDVDFEDIQLSADDEYWDPHEAWVDSLGEDRDDA